jgi:hypothetical protein
VCPAAWRDFTRECTYGEDWLEGGPSSFTIWMIVSFQLLHSGYLLVIRTKICITDSPVYVKAGLLKLGSLSCGQENGP